MIKYTVIIPHYNDIESLPKLIESIPRREDIQIIVIDDNTYETHEEMTKLVREMDRKEVELYFNDPDHRGAGGCRNIGLSHERGEWLIFADSDDYFLDGAFDVFDRTVDPETDDEVDMYFFLPTSVELPSMKRGKRHVLYAGLVRDHAKKQTRHSEEELRYNFLVPWSRMVRAKMVRENEIRYDDVRWSNDVMFAARCGYYAKKIRAVDEVVYCATRKTGTLTTSVNATTFCTRFDVYVNKYVFLREKGGNALVKRVMTMPVAKVVLAKLNKLDSQVTKHIFKSYRDNKISVFSFSIYDVKRGFLKLIMFMRDKKFHK